MICLIVSSVSLASSKTALCAEAAGAFRRAPLPAQRSARRLIFGLGLLPRHLAEFSSALSPRHPQPSTSASIYSPFWAIVHDELQYELSGDHCRRPCFSGPPALSSSSRMSDCTRRSAALQPRRALSSGRGRFEFTSAGGRPTCCRALEAMIARLPFLRSAPAMFMTRDRGVPKYWGTGQKGAVEKIKCEALLRAQEFRVTGPPVAPAFEDNPSPKIASSKGTQAEWE